ncbi:MAG: glycosyltransferase [Oligoflexia bacterium]|nr:glycosyltransferase [Oligoflexia bacterium]
MEHIDVKTEELALKTLRTNKVAIFMLSYNAQDLIVKTLQRIPHWIARELVEIYVIDDSSKDKTLERVSEMPWPKDFAPMKIYRTPYNQGFGGNQRLGYLYAISKGYDIVVSLHADGQYAPEALPVVLAPYSQGADAVFGSRFMTPMGALKGNMPLYKFLGNKVLTRLQNFLLGTKMSEMHSGYRSYRMSGLKQVPFEFNSLSFDYDADIIIQLVAAKLKVVEVPIPTFYGDEISHVNGTQYAWRCIKTAVKYKMMEKNLFYDPKFDLERVDQQPYVTRAPQTSLHEFVKSASLPKDARILDLCGGQDKAISRVHAQGGIPVTCVEIHPDPIVRQNHKLSVDLNKSWKDQIPTGQNFNVVYALDVLEHLQFPERGAREIFERMNSGGALYASVNNIAFLPMRLSLLFGHFNYGRKGILGFTHSRLFTIETFTRLMKNAGFRVDAVMGFAPPAFENKGIMSRVMGFLARALPRLFASQILLVCTRTDSPLDLMKQTFREDFGREAAPDKVKLFSLGV